MNRKIKCLCACLTAMVMTGLWFPAPVSGASGITIQQKAIYPFSEGLAGIRTENSIVFVDQFFETIIDFTDTPLPGHIPIFSEGLCALYDGQYFGYINQNGSVVIPFEYDWAGPFGDGLAKVQKKGRWMYIDQQGNQAFLLPDEVAYISDFQEGYAIIAQNEETFDFIDAGGRYKAFYKGDPYASGGFSDGLARVVLDDGTIGYINSNWHMAIVLPEDYAAGNFSGGYAWVRDADGLYGYMDQSGEMIIPAQYTYASDFKEGLAFVETHENKFWIDHAGAVVTQWSDRKFDLSNYSEGYFVNDRAFYPLEMILNEIRLEEARLAEEKRLEEARILAEEEKRQREEEEARLLAEAQKSEEIHITISAIGDCTLGHDAKYGYAMTLPHELEKQDADFGYFFALVKEILDADDLTIANMEGPLTNSTQKAEKEFAFRGDPSYTKILKEGSVEAVNLSNNHTLDYGWKGFQDTIQSLEQAEITFFGEGHSPLIERKGITIGLLGYKGWANSKSLQKQIETDIENLKRQGADLVVVSFHWGEERVHYPNETQKQLGRFAVDAGADLVLGHHPHVLQGIELYHGKYIVYSLGNFCFGGNKNPADKDTMIFQQTFIFNQDKELQDQTIQIFPAMITSTPSRNNYQPKIAEGSDKTRIENRLAEYSKAFGTGDVIRQAVR